MRAFNLMLAVILLALLAVFGSVAWLGASDAGTRWLISQMLTLSPVPIEIEGVQGSLVGGLEATSVEIELPVARISIKDVSVAWRPADLVAGRIALTDVGIHSLTVDLVETEEAPVSDRDLLFWLHLPVDVRIQRGHIDSLRIVKAEFEQIDLDAALGWGRLAVRRAAARIAGIDLQLAGNLSGATPGDLDAELRWQWPAMGYAGGGTFAGDIDVLNFAHRVQLPDAVDVTGAITSLFYKPQLTGIASWDAVTIPGGQPLVVSAGEANIGSDFVSARVAARASLIVADWQPMPAQMNGVIRLDGATIDSFRLEAFEGELTGDGELSFVNGVSGALDVSARNIGLGYLFPEYPGHVGFDSRLDFKTATDIDIAIARFDGELYGKSLAGRANIAVRGGGIAAIDGDVALAKNSLSANLQLVPMLDGTAQVKVTDLADIWPDARGAVDAKISIAGSIEKPRAALSGRAAGLNYASVAAADVTARFTYAHGKEVSGSLIAAGLNYAGNDLGELRASISGQPANHATEWSLTGGLVAADAKTSGSWDGALLKQRITTAQIQPRDFAAWELTDKPELILSGEAAQLEGHCWSQDAARLCFGETAASPDLATASFNLQRFPLLALSSFLPADVKVTGLADAEGTLRMEGGMLRGRFGWKQGETVLAYQLDDDTLETPISELTVSVEFNDALATLAASVLGPDGLKLRAKGSVALPVSDGSALTGELVGILPDISLFRPLILRVADTGEMEGVGRINLRIGGTVGDPVFSGGAFLERGLLQLPAAGTTLTDINISATSAGGDNLLLAGNLRAGDGTARVSGNIVLTDTGGVVADLLLAGENLATVRQPELNLLSSPQLQVRVDDKGVDVSGRVVIPEATARIRELPPEAVKRSADVVIHTDEQSLEYDVDEKVVTGDIEVVLGDKVQFYGFGLESRLDGSLRLTQRPGRTLRGNGTVRVRDGFLTGYGKELRVDRGTLTFTGPLDDPVVDVQVSRDTTYENRRYTVGLRLSGTASNLKTEPFSRPAMSEQDILAFLLLDRPASGSGEDTGVSGALLAMGLGQMIPGDGGKFGLDEISFEGSEFNQTAVVAGKRISDDIYIRYVFGLFGQPGQFRIRYRLGRGFSLEATTGGTSQALDLIYLIERE